MVISIVMLVYQRVSVFIAFQRSSGVAMTIVDLIRGNLPENMGVEPWKMERSTCYQPVAIRKSLKNIRMDD